ncbi:hypothetical protein IF2G_07103 [Cordyceps javanica]|nr:hypothetical protein IF2G_07103 [Cordyceps javanica]
MVTFSMTDMKRFDYGCMNPVSQLKSQSQKSPFDPPSTLAPALSTTLPSCRFLWAGLHMGPPSSKEDLSVLKACAGTEDVGSTGRRRE